MTIRAGWGWLALAALGCGDGLVGDGYRGEPVAQLPLEVSSLDDPAHYDGVPVRVALFWSPAGPDAPLDALVEQPVTSAAAAPLDRVALNVFEHPAPALWVAGAAGGYGLARALAYRDDDGDHRKDADEPFVGMNGPSALLYAPAGGATGPSGNAVPAGFHLVRSPVPCAPEPTPPVAARADDCGVALGDGCSHVGGMGGMGAADAACGGAGRCLTDSPGGLCVLPVGDAPGCRPASGRLAVVEGLSMGPTVAWLKACDDDSACRVGEGYRCDQWRGICLPAERLTVILGADRPSALCQPAMGGQGMSLPASDAALP